MTERKRGKEAEREKEELGSTMTHPSPVHGWAEGTECVGKYNFVGSAQHVSYMKVTSCTSTCIWAC